MTTSQSAWPEESDPDSIPGANGRVSFPNDGAVTPISPTADAILPRLTRLEMSGFKSFAQRTAFQFEPGITAVVGPNGSGKSNIADAVRWALGETSYSSLRSKKTEDVIFAGGTGRAPAGMAEVTLTFDNSTGWLPIDFTEVTVTRRAFRSGETAFLINGRKVRLKDVHQLTSSLGQSYTVVGQGLVDAALSQRAEERRGLFEHAADLTGLRLKAAEAERNLAETETNSQRLTDLMAEVEPRLRMLERAARQANDYREMRDRLRSVQRNHFRGLLLAANQRLAVVEEAASGGRSRADAIQTRHDDLVARAMTHRLDRDRAADQLEEHRAGLQATTEQLRRVRHEREIANERLAALIKRREDMEETQRGLDEQIASVRSGLADVATLLASADQVATESRVRRDEADAAVASERAARSACEREHARLLALVTDRERQIADASRRKALLVQRTETDTAERERNEAARSERQDRRTRLDAELTELDAADEAALTRAEHIRVRQTELTADLETAAGVRDAAETRIHEIEQEIIGRRARLRELKRIHESGAGLFAGVKAVLLAARHGHVEGVRGTIAELIEIPAKFDTAMEVALGGHLQDIVVDTWTTAQEVISYLRRENAGRATFQPIDTVRGHGPAAELVRDLLARPGVHGVASELLSAPPDLEGVVQALLGRSVIVDDLAVARSCLSALPPGWSAITVTGEVARSGGSVTGGTAVRESGALARERDLRQLPAQISDLERSLESPKQTLAAAVAEMHAASDEQRTLDAERISLLATTREHQQQRARLVSWLAELDRDGQRSDARAGNLDQSRAEAELQLQALDGELRQLASERDGARSELDAIAQTMSRSQEDVSPAEIALRDAQQQLATQEERLHAERRRESALTAQQTALLQERSLRAERAASVDGEITAIGTQAARLGAEIAALDVAHESGSSALEPRAARHARALADLAAIEEELEQARAGLIDAERQLGASGVDVERMRGELGALRQRIVDDLEIHEPNDLLDAVDQGDRLADDCDDAEQEIARLKDRLRRIGYAGENAVEDYERERERHSFLRDQLADVQGAAVAIRDMLDEVRATMQQRFEETFNRVSTVFSQMFSTLFGGGSARLIMVTGEDGDKTGGIDIVAQPPGKRLQSLALLSGGERALTGVALLFAILKVNPTPFCLLDEVDAALDEANVVRFRDQLTRLARETQAIIITHNRGTIEAAETLYGVSMKEDGTSTVLSLRLSDVVLAD